MSIRLQDQHSAPAAPSVAYSDGITEGWLKIEKKLSVSIVAFN